MKTGACIMTDHSTLFHHFQLVDILTGLTPEILSSRQEMERTPKSGGLMERPIPLRAERTTNHGTLPAQVKPKTCKSIAPILNGGNSSSILIIISSIPKMEEHLMLKEAKILKVQTSLPPRELKKTTRNGELSMLMKLQRFKLKATMRSSVCIATDHSTSDLDSQ